MAESMARTIAGVILTAFPHVSSCNGFVRKGSAGEVEASDEKPALQPWEVNWQKGSVRVADGMQSWW